MGIISTILVIISVEYKACIVCMFVSTRVVLKFLLSFLELDTKTRLFRAC
jgi:hypothetical protein